MTQSYTDWYTVTVSISKNKKGKITCNLLCNLVFTYYLIEAISFYLLFRHSVVLSTDHRLDSQTSSFFSDYPEFIGIIEWFEVIKRLTAHQRRKRADTDIFGCFFWVDYHFLLTNVTHKFIKCSLGWSAAVNSVVHSLYKFINWLQQWPQIHFFFRAGCVATSWVFGQQLDYMKARGVKHLNSVFVITLTPTRG